MRILVFLLTMALAGTALRGTAQPAITVQPRNQTNLVGTTATFTVEATGTTPLFYQWRSHANPTIFTNIPFGTEPTLVLTNVEPTSRRFAVVVTDGTGLSVTSTPLVTLTVLTPPVITQQPTNYFVFLSGPASLYVTAAGTGPLRYQWMFNSLTNPVPGATNSSLLFSSLRTNQAGNYHVVVTNAIGAVTSSVARVGYFWAPTTGTDIPALSRLDTNMQSLLFRYGIPGGALAVVKDGRLVFTRGYGYADTNTGEVVQPDSLFRVASNSKLITAVATMKLVESELLSLSNSVLSTLGFPQPEYPGSTNDPRMASLTVQHLLQHTGGWDRDNAPNPNGGNKFDPVGWSELPARVMGVQGAFSSSNLVEWILGLGLQFQPGSRFAYSNVGYVLLGRIIEAVTGRPYEEYVRSVLRDAGISRMRVSPETLSGWLPGQAVNYDYPTSLSVPYLVQYGVEPRPGDRPMPYSYSTRRTDAAYGWCSSPIDYLRLVNAIDGRPSPADILSAQSVRIMTTPSAVSIGAGEPYGMGLDIDYPNPGDWFHGGSITGTRSKMFRLANGITIMYAVNFNPYLDSTFESFMDTIITGSLGSIPAWPTNDFFPTTLSYDAWRDRRFTPAELAVPTISGDRADPDGDGSPNLFEYASGSDPRDPANHRQPSGSFVTVDGQPYFALTFRRLMLGYEVDYVVEASSDLASWSPVTEPVGPPQLNSDGTQTVTIRDTTPQSASHQRFLRLTVSRQAQDQ